MSRVQADKRRCTPSDNRPELLLRDGAGGGADCEDFVGGLEAPPKKPLEGAEGLGAGLERRALPPTHSQYADSGDLTAGLSVSRNSA